jgi:hypothetical protein
MSQTNDFKQANNPDRVYYDILQHNIGRNTETPARFIETTETPIINNTGDYKMSVVRFQIDTPNMPVLIIQPNTNKNQLPFGGLQNLDAYVATDYMITLNYFHGDYQHQTPRETYSFFIDWKPQNTNVYKPTFEEYKDGKHINYEYFYCYSYSYFFDFIVNQSIKVNYGGLLDLAYTFALNLGDDTEFNRQYSNWLYPPTFEWDENTQKINICVSPNFITCEDYLKPNFGFPIYLGQGNSDVVYTSTISVSSNFYTLISTFPYEIDRVANPYTNIIQDVYTLSFRTNFLTNWIKSVPPMLNLNYTNLNYMPYPSGSPHAMEYGAFLIKAEQEWSSIDLMTPINSIVFISNTLPIIANQQSASKNKNNKDIYTPDSERNTTQHLLMITDLMTNQQGYRPNLLYVPSGQYRYITLTGNQPLNQIDINVFYQLKTGELIPFQLTNGGTASIKILFEKVVLGETKTLQFANMSMRDLKL